MSTIYRVNDTFDLKIDNVVFSLSPLDYKTKADMQACIMAGKPMDAAVKALKNSVKKASGLKLVDGSDYELEFAANGELSDNTVNDLLNIPEASKLNLVSITLIHGMPQGEFMDPETGKPLAGVSFVKKAGSSKKK